jgi:hypothetical protein
MAGELRALVADPVAARVGALYAAREPATSQTAGIPADAPVPHADESPAKSAASAAATPSEAGE